MGNDDQERKVSAQDEKDDKQPAPGDVNASGGVYAGGDVATGGGDFTGRDKNIHGDEVCGDKVLGDQYKQYIYPQIRPPSVDATTLNSALNVLAQMPVEHVPPLATLPPGARMPFSPNPLFVGREADLRSLAITLKGGQTVAVGQIAAATGLGGIGKTQLAVAFVHHYGQFFLGGVHWLNFNDPYTVPTELAACGRMMADMRPDFATLDLDDQVRFVQTAWQSPLPRLLIFDNCEDPALLARWRPTTGACRVLVTSRRHQWDAALNVAILELDTLERPNSIALLRKFRSELPPTDIALDQIAAELGDLPLAVHLAGSYLARYRRAVSPADYLAMLHRRSIVDHTSLQMGDLSPTGHVQHVVRTFALSYEQLNRDNAVDALALDLLACAACFAPGALIPRALLLSSGKIEGAEHTLQAEDAIQRLVDLGLLEAEVDGALRVHRLVAHFVGLADATAWKQARLMVEVALLKEAWRINDSGLPRALLDWQIHLRHVTDLAHGRQDTQTANLCDALAEHLSMLGDFSAAKPYLERALAIREARFSQQHPDTANSYNNLGMVLVDMWEFATAKPYLERALAIREARLGQQHPDTANSYNNLGALLLGMGDFSAAKPYLERALAIREAHLGKQHLDTANSYNNLGALLKATDDLSAAKNYYERALAILEARLGQQHPNTAASYNNLGMLLFKMGNLPAAKNYLERALAIWEDRLGKQHPYTITVYNSLSLSLVLTGDLPAPEPSDMALTIMEVMHHKKPGGTQRIQQFVDALEALLAKKE